MMGYRESLMVREIRELYKLHLEAGYEPKEALQMAVDYWRLIRGA